MWRDERKLRATHLEVERNIATTAWGMAHKTESMRFRGNGKPVFCCNQICHLYFIAFHINLCDARLMYAAWNGCTQWCLVWRQASIRLFTWIHTPRNCCATIEMKWNAIGTLFRSFNFFRWRETGCHRLQHTHARAHRVVDCAWDLWNSSERSKLNRERAHCTYPSSL